MFMGIEVEGCTTVSSLKKSGVTNDRTTKLRRCVIFFIRAHIANRLTLIGLIRQCRWVVGRFRLFQMATDFSN